jgi:hypothetical protein
MDRAKDLEKLLGEMMSPEATEIQSPDLGYMYKARAAVAARKKSEVAERAGFFEKLFLFFKLDFKFYHVGLSVLLIFAGIFYMTEPNYSAGNSQGFMEYHEALSIKNTTISVNSSTMLTSIPTTVIRN